MEQMTNTQIVDLIRNPPAYSVAATALYEWLRANNRLRDVPQEVEDWFAAIGVQECLISRLERLPIETESVTTPPIRRIGFVLCGGTWWPCAAMNRTGNKPGWVEYRVDDTGDGCTSGVALWPTWGEVGMDDAPTIIDRAEAFADPAKPPTHTQAPAPSP